MEPPISSAAMRSPTPKSAAAMPETSSSSTSLGRSEAMMNPSVLTIADPTMSGETDRRERSTLWMFSTRLPLPSATVVLLPATHRASRELHGHLTGALAVGVALGLERLRLPLDQHLGDAGDEAHLELADALADVRHPRAGDALVEVHDEGLVGELARLEDPDLRVPDELAHRRQILGRIGLVEHRPGLLPQLPAAVLED